MAKKYIMQLKNINILGLILGISALLAIGLVVAKSLSPSKKLSKEALSTQLDKIYTNLSGFGIDQAEADYILSQGGAPTYGEIVYPSMDALIKKLKIKKDDVFYDLGSGVGKFVAYMYLATDIKKSVGIELAESRYKKSMQALQRMKKAGLIERKRELKFIHADITKEDLSDATVIFMCATCFSNDLLQKLTDRFVELKPGLRIITLKKLPDHPRLKYIEKNNLPTSWSNGSPMNHYQLLPEPGVN